MYVMYDVLLSTKINKIAVVGLIALASDYNLTLPATLANIQVLASYNRLSYVVYDILLSQK